LECGDLSPLSVTGQLLKKSAEQSGDKQPHSKLGHHHLLSKPFDMVRLLPRL
jgi:hypothetical protein